MSGRIDRYGELIDEDDAPPVLRSLTGSTTGSNRVVCSGCGADEMGCDLKAHYSGRRCCDACGHSSDKAAS